MRWAWWHMPIISLHGRVRPEDLEFEASLDYRARPYLKRVMDSHDNQLFSFFGRKSGRRPACQRRQTHRVSGWEEGEICGQPFAIVLRRDSSTNREWNNSQNGTRKACASEGLHLGSPNLEHFLFVFTLGHSKQQPERPAHKRVVLTLNLRSSGEKPHPQTCDL